MDREILNLIKQAPQILKNDPCEQCTANFDGSCCGCPKGREYKAAAEPYTRFGDEVLLAAKEYIKFRTAKAKLTKLGFSELCK